MDLFFQQYNPADIFLDDIFPLPPMNQSAFVAYTKTPFAAVMQESHGSRTSCKNINQRMLEFLRRNWALSCQDPEREKGIKHMMNERLRRGRQKQSLIALHSMLPHGTKNDKNSIMRMAAKNIRELEKYKEELQRRSRELETSLVKLEEEREKTTKISFKVPNSTFPISTMIEVLKCLKNMETKTTSIQSCFADQELVATFGIQSKYSCLLLTLSLILDSKVEAAKIEKAVQETVHKVEKKLVECQHPVACSHEAGSLRE